MRKQDRNYFLLLLPKLAYNSEMEHVKFLAITVIRCFLYYSWSIPGLTINPEFPKK